LVQLFILVLTLFLSVQAPAFVPDPPHKCDDCPMWNKPREPFKVYGNTYYVGTDGLSAVLVTSGAGHVLFDGGLTQSAPLIIDNIRRLGFKPQDIKLILVSHGHFDHGGGVNSIQRYTRARVAASAPTTEALRRGENTPDDPQFALGKAVNGFPPVRRVDVVRDQQVVKAGEVAITVHLIPGHSPGSTAYTWQSCENGRCLHMVYADSLTSVSAPGFKYGMRLESFRRSIEKVAALPCDIILSPHPQFTQVDEKLKRRSALHGQGTDPFIDPNGCRTYAASALQQLDARIREESKP
jgi:metallo-beta-lactamase class B